MESLCCVKKSFSWKHESYTMGFSEKPLMDFDLLYKTSSTAFHSSLSHDKKPGNSLPIVLAQESDELLNLFQVLPDVWSQTLNHKTSWHVETSQWERDPFLTLENLAYFSAPLTFTKSAGIHYSQGTSAHQHCYSVSSRWYFISLQLSEAVPW